MTFGGFPEFSKFVVVVVVVEDAVGKHVAGEGSVRVPWKTGPGRGVVPVSGA